MNEPSEHIGQTEGEFSVCQFFSDSAGTMTGTHEYTRRFVSAKEAVEAAHHYCNSIAAKNGIVDRVIITDGSDCVNFEWQFGKGVTFR